jgi:threonine/homoserine/homoserine lactone efflux protein
LKDAKYIEEKEASMIQKVKRKRISLLKGLTMVLLNPLGIVSWMVALSFLRKTGFFIPLTMTHKALFFTVVTLGALFYFLSIIFITNRMKHFFDQQRTKKLIRTLGFVLLSFSLYFFILSMKTFFW